MKLQFFLLVPLIVMTGCADLIIRNEDTAGEMAGKVGARVVLGLATIGISELEISQIQAKEEREARERTIVDNWNKAIGIFTYDDALRQFGPPSSVAEGRDVLVAVWQSGPGPTLWIPVPSLGFGPTYLGAQAPGHRLELTFSRSAFDQEQKILRHWRTW